MFTIGYPTPSLLGRDPKYTNGTVSALSGVGGDASFMQISVPVQPGNSGGPVLTEQGQVIGLVVSRITLEGAENINFALPINYVRGQLALASTRTLQPLAEVRVTATGGNAPVSTFGPATASNEFRQPKLKAASILPRPQWR